MESNKNNNREYLISKCRYYNGEDQPPRSLPEGYALMWDYESRWVEWTLADDPMIKGFKRTIKEYHLESRNGDQTPLTLKALLINRYLYWNTGSGILRDDLKAFEGWYKSFYQRWKTNAERNVPVSPVFGISRHRMGLDGKGVTTLVTFMGCPLKCKYCLNDQCHGEVYEEDGKTPREGILLLTPLELYDIVKQDNIYFQTTGGGICFGGGEPTMQADFIVEFAKLCPKNWKITLETSLRCSYNTFKLLAPHVDHWIADIKDMDSCIYQDYTGVMSGVMQHLICLEKLVPLEKVTIKVPHIPDFNTDEDVKRSIEELQERGFYKIEECQYIKRIARITDITG